MPGGCERDPSQRVAIGLSRVEIHSGPVWGSLSLTSTKLIGMKLPISSEKRVALEIRGLAPFVRLDVSAPKFKKEVLRTGRWIHPATGESLDFDPEFLERLAEDTNRWIALGQKVHFPAGPDCHAEDARDALKNIGYWSNFRVEEGRLVADVEVPDQAAAEKIGKTIQDVSPEIRWPARSATGEILEAAIFHVAATPIPAIPGQSNFERLSQLAREVPMSNEAPTASTPSPAKSVDLLAWAREKLALPPDAPQEAVLEALEQRIMAATQAPAPAETAVLAQLTREVKDAREESKAANRLVAELRAQCADEKRKRDEEAVESARQETAEAGLPIPEETCKLALSLFAKDEDVAARELLSVYTARAKDLRLASSRTFESPPASERRTALSLREEAAEKLLLEDDHWVVKTRKDGSIKRDANGRPRLVRRDAKKE